MRRLFETLRPIFTARFLKFCVVGASGVLVNLGVLALLTGLDVRSSFASAWAIEVSILSNFVINERWTFVDRGEGTVWSRAVRFQLVSLVGGAVQWLVFLASIVALLRFMHGPGAIEQYFAGDGLTFQHYVQRLVREPPDVGAGVYPAQLVGIAAATGWNFLANFYWTWRRGEPSEP